MTVWQMDLIPWYVLAAYFLLSALRMTRSATKRRTSGWTWTLVLVAGFFLIFEKGAGLRIWNTRFVPAVPFLEYLGVAITAAGVGVTLWARYVLGEYWSGQVKLKASHRLVQSGPYRYVRHPLYTGILLGLVGTVTIVGEWRAVAGYVLAVIGFSLKARKEEALLSAEFKDAYVDYRNRTGFLLPRLWSARTTGNNTPASSLQ